MRPVTVAVGPLAAAVANNIALSQSLGGAAAVTINGSLATGGVATLDVARRVLITSAANDSGITFLISGTNWSGAKISETVTGANASTVASVLDYKTVTSIVSSGATAGNITVGTNGVAASPWVRLDEWASAQVALQCTASGTVNYTVQQTLDDPNSNTNAVALSAMTWISHPDSNLVGATGSVQGNYAYLPVFCRILLNSGTGTVTMTVNQAGAVTI